MINLAHRLVGPAVALSVANSSHAAVTISDWTNDQCNQCLMWNSGATTVAVFISAANAPTAVLPVDGTTQGSPQVQVIVLPPSMVTPLPVITPQTPFSMTAIGSGAGPSIVYVMPIGNQS